MKTYTEKELIKFGEYLLSDKRKKMVREDNQQSVHHADIENFNDYTFVSPNEREKEFETYVLTGVVQKLIQFKEECNTIIIERLQQKLNNLEASLFELAIKYKIDDTIIPMFKELDELMDLINNLKEKKDTLPKNNKLGTLIK